MKINWEIVFSRVLTVLIIIAAASSLYVALAVYEGNQDIYNAGVVSLATQLEQTTTATGVASFSYNNKTIYCLSEEAAKAVADERVTGNID